MKTPKFWFPDTSTPSLWAKTISICLKPLSYIFYIGGILKRGISSPYHSKISVICIGNAIAGGAGKTPTSIALANLVKNIKETNAPIFLTRGYGGIKKGPLLAVPDKHNYRHIGDEALLLTKHAPTIVSKRRDKGAKLSEKLEYNLIIMDDGFQNTSVFKDIHIMVVDARGFGNECMIPAGPLREPLHDALRRADIFIATAEIPPCTMAKIKATGKPFFQGHYATDTKPDTQTEYIGFSGLADPAKFQKTLIQNKFSLVDYIAFPDHHPYTKSDIKKLLRLAKNNNAQLITTSKDFVRIPSQYQDNIETLPITLEILEQNQLIAILKTKLTALGKYNTPSNQSH